MEGPLTVIGDPSPETIEQFERINALAEQCRALVQDITGLPTKPPPGTREALPAGMDTRPVAVDRRWLAIAQTHLQQGFMALRRSIDPEEKW